MRRRRREQTITLFAFQDIITGVAGVMLFILLLLVVQLTVKTVQAAADQAEQQQEVTPEQAARRAELESFAQTQQDVDALTQQLEALASQLYLYNTVLNQWSLKVLNSQ